jgi:hypothetical protein
MIAGAILAAVAAAVVAFGDLLGLELSRFALLGLAIGAVLGLVPAGSAPERAAAWAVGFLLAWLGYAARVSLLPDTSSGRAVAVAGVVLAVAAVAALTYGRLSLWAGLLGVAAMVGAYEVTFSQAPSAFWTDSTAAVTTVALATGMGFLATSLMVRPVPSPVDEDTEENRAEGSVPGPRHAEPDAGMGIVDWSRSEA